MISQTWTIPYLRQGYAAGEFTVADVMDEVCRRAAETEDSHVWIVPPAAERIASYVTNLETRWAAGEDLPLYGVPFAVKDNIDVAGVPTTAACPEYSYIPEEDATVVARLVAAGAVPVGKTNLDQFATGLVGTRSPYGECHNSLRPELISGGSSSGSAVAVALGQVAFSLGTDTAGSGRVPAALNDLVGFKPPLGSWSTHGVVPACASLDCVTVFAHSIEDAQAVDAVAAGYDERCIWSRRYERTAPELPARILVPDVEPRFYGDFAEEYRAAWHQAVDQLRLVAERAGVTFGTFDVEPLAKAALILYDGPWVAERWRDLGPFVRKHPGATFPVTEQILRSGDSPDHTAEALFGSLHYLQAVRHEVTDALDDAVLVMPTCGGTFTRDQVRENPIATNSLMGLYTNHCNLLDMVAMDVPCDFAADKLPFGVTAFAPAAHQAQVVGLGTAFEEARGCTLAVCGQHMRGGLLHDHLEHVGAVFLEVARTSADYRLYTLPGNPVRPALVRGEHGGASIEVELYRIPMAGLGPLVAAVPAPLGFGKIMLFDGREVEGFLGEAAAVYAPGVVEITDQGSFRSFL